MWEKTIYYIGISYRYHYRYRPIRKLSLSGFISIGRYEKKLIGRTLDSTIIMPNPNAWLLKEIGSTYLFLFILQFLFNWAWNDWWYQVLQRTAFCIWPQVSQNLLCLSTYSQMPAVTCSTTMKHWRMWRSRRRRRKRILLHWRISCMLLKKRGHQ